MSVYQKEEGDKKVAQTSMDEQFLTKSCEE